MQYMECDIVDQAISIRKRFKFYGEIVRNISLTGAFFCTLYVFHELYTLKIDQAYIEGYVDSHKGSHIRLDEIDKRRFGNSKIAGVK